MGGSIAFGGSETITAETLSFGFINRTSEIDDFINTVIGWNAVITALNLVIDMFDRSGYPHNIIGMKVVMSEMEGFLVGNQGGDDLE